MQPEGRIWEPLFVGVTGCQAPARRRLLSCLCRELHRLGVSAAIVPGGVETKSRPFWQHAVVLLDGLADDAIPSIELNQAQGAHVPETHALLRLPRLEHCVSPPPASQLAYVFVALLRIRGTAIVASGDP